MNPVFVEFPKRKLLCFTVTANNQTGFVEVEGFVSEGDVVATLQRERLEHVVMPALCGSMGRVMHG